MLEVDGVFLVQVELWLSSVSRWALSVFLITVSSINLFISDAFESALDVAANGLQPLRVLG